MLTLQNHRVFHAQYTTRLHSVESAPCRFTLDRRSQHGQYILLNGDRVDLRSKDVSAQNASQATQEEDRGGADLVTRLNNPPEDLDIALFTMCSPVAATSVYLACTLHLLHLGGLDPVQSQSDYCFGPALVSLNMVKHFKHLSIWTRRFENIVNIIPYSPSL